MEAFSNLNLDDDFDYVKKETIDEDLICPICTDPFISPVSIPNCQHIFCRRCIEKVVTQTCPTCRNKFEFGKLSQPHRFIMKSLGSLEVRCTNKNCKWEGTREKLASHKRECTELSIPCQFEKYGCEFIGNQVELEKHSNENCRFKDIKKLVESHSTLQKRVDTLEKSLESFRELLMGILDNTSSSRASTSQFQFASSSAWPSFSTPAQPPSFNPQPSNPFGTSRTAPAFGSSSTTAPRGTSIYLFQPTSSREETFSGVPNMLHSITAMPIYDSKSFEELRFEDMQSNPNLSKSNPLFRTPFGSSTVSNSNANPTSSGFSFGGFSSSNSTFGSSFGNSNPPSSGFSFGSTPSSGFAVPSSTSNQFGFGSAPTFGQTSSLSGNSPFGFGSTSTGFSFPNSNSNSGFGTNNVFGSNSKSTNPPHIFGNFASQSNSASPQTSSERPMELGQEPQIASTSSERQVTEAPPRQQEERETPTATPEPVFRPPRQQEELETTSTSVQPVLNQQQEEQEEVKKPAE